MNRSVVPKIRVPTVEELEATPASSSVITKTSTFTRYREGQISDDSSISAQNLAETKNDDQPAPSTLSKRKHEEEPPKNLLNNFIETASPAASTTSGPRPGGSTVIVNSRQKGNPLLRFLRNVPYEYGQTTADYILGESCCALFLSLKFHKLHSDYVHERLKEVGHQYALQILLVQVDIQEPEQALRELNTICFNANWTLMLAWSPEEAAELIEAYKIYENKPPDFLMGRQETDPRARLVYLLTSIKSITRTDAENLISTFGSLKNMVEATEEQLAICPGLGLKKAKRLYSAFGAPWRVGIEVGKESGTRNLDEGEGTSRMNRVSGPNDLDADELFEGD